MINANEIKIGNFFYEKINTGQCRPPELIIRFFDEEYLEVLFAARNYEDYEPIPLTPEILLMCGFKRNDWDNGSAKGSVFTKELNHYYSLVYEIYSGGTKKFFIQGEYDCEQNIIEVCKYLHQLQNLYFAFTLEELKININVATIQ